MEMNGTTILGALLAVLATFVLSTEGVPFTRTLSDDELEHLGNYLNSISPKGSNDPYGWEKDFLSSGTPLDVYGGNMWGNFLKGVRSEPESEAVQPAMKRFIPGRRRFRVSWKAK
ncbi:uncharacterized protein LOC135482426 [Lineus longissimus]|uniref:uncharacterized protein LOC135482426 n=1 Tax=Lineus longissimus TaxID=88925 RepID=UPI002B4D4F5C